MAIIKCSDCGKELSDKATVCLNCACPVENNKLYEYINKEYRGQDSIIIIDDDTIYYKALIRKTEFKITEIISVKWTDAKTFEYGSIEITLRKTIIPYTISFTKKESQLFNELYNLLLERKSLIKKSAQYQSVNKIETNQAITEAQVNKMNIKPTKAEIRANKINDKINKQELKASRLDAKLKKQELKTSKVDARLKQQELYDINNMARCSRCNSTSLSSHKKGFGIGKAVLGASIFGPFGLMAGNAGAKKVIVTCLKCGKQFRV